MPLDVEGVGGIRTSYPSSRRVAVQLETEFGELLTMEGSTLPIVARPAHTIDWEAMRERWSHLTDLPLKSSGGQVDILLGLDNAHLMIPREIRHGSHHQPIASRTRLGWMVRGKIDEGDQPLSRKLARLHHVSATTAELEQGLVDQLRRFCDTEAFGTEHQEECVSPENRTALETLKNDIRKLETGYEAPRLWKTREPNVVDNHVVASHHNQCLIHCFKRDPVYENRFRAAMEKTFDEGYAVRLKPEELGSDPANYLPIFGISKKGSAKVRIVFDAAAKFKGKSFNDRVHPGLVLQNSLPRIIIRFREGEVAWAADIQAMFSRIRLRREDWKFHRFLWPERDGSVSICEMRRLTFGVSCSPCVAIYTTWKAGEDAGDAMRHAADAIKTICTSMII